MVVQNQPSELESLLYDCIVELSYVQSVEGCEWGLCATSKGQNLIERGMKLLGVADLGAESLEAALHSARTQG